MIIITRKTQVKRETLKIVLDENGNKIVILPDIIFSNKQNIDWNEVESSGRFMVQYRQILHHKYRVEGAGMQNDCYEIMHLERRVANIDGHGHCKIYYKTFLPYHLYLEE